MYNKIHESPMMIDMKAPPLCYFIIIYIYKQHGPVQSMPFTVIGTVIRYAATYHQVAAVVAMAG